MTSTLDDLVTARIDSKGWTRGELAKRAGMSESGLRNLCRGLVAHPRGTTISPLAKALGIDPAKVRAAIAASRAAADR